MSMHANDPDSWLASLHELREKGEFEEALRGYAAFLAEFPGRPEAWYFRSMTEQALGDFAAAERSLRSAIELVPTMAAVHLQLGHLRRIQGDMQGALETYYQAYQLDRQDADACNNVGATLQALARYEEAVEAYQIAIEIAPHRVPFRNNLGLLYAILERYSEALEVHRQALMLDSRDVESWLNLGNAYQHLGGFEEAVQAYQQAILLQPNLSRAYYNLSVAFTKLKRHSDALWAAEQRYRLSPNNGNSAAALLHRLQGDCQWERLSILSEKVVQWVASDAPETWDEPIAPFAFLGLPIETTPELQQKCAAKWCTKVRRQASVARCSLPKHQPRPRPQRLRIGYLSEDFHAHPVAYSVVELFEAHCRDRFEIVAYSYGADDQSPIRRRIESSFDLFRNVAHSRLDACVQQIVDDKIDILVDLQGYTGESRSEILAWRPAPIQVNYLGYPGTMAADFMDYILVDDFVAPQEHQPFFREKFVYLPGSYLVADSQLAVGPAPTRSTYGLPDDSLVLCCFNSSYKITPSLFDLWMRVLVQVPQAVLWLRDWGETTKINLRCEANARGVDPDRIYFAPEVDHAEHAARHELADLFVDTFPYNAHATASLALRLGLPVLTMAGKTFPSRVAGSLIGSLGFEQELVADSMERYESMLLQLATHHAQRESLRARLKRVAPGHPTFNGRDFARRIEQAYNQMWDIYQRGEMPRSFKVG